MVDRNGGAVSLTTTVNHIFGSGIMDPATGIILNNQQNDFSTAGSINVYGFRPSRNNFVVPGKRPLSSTTPTIIENERGELTMVVGGSGGSEIITGTANVSLPLQTNNDKIAHNLFFSF